MKTATLILLGLLFMGGCGAMKGIEASINRDKMNSLEVGMSKDEVRKIMGKPYKREIYQSQEIWFYITEWQSDGYTTLDEMTPLVFEKDTLIGWGSNFVDENLKKYELRIR